MAPGILPEMAQLPLMPSSMPLGAAFFPWSAPMQMPMMPNSSMMFPGMQPGVWPAACPGIALPGCSCSLEPAAMSGLAPSVPGAPSLADVWSGAAPPLPMPPLGNGGAGGRASAQPEAASAAHALQSVQPPPGAPAPSFSGLEPSAGSAAAAASGATAGHEREAPAGERLGQAPPPPSHPGQAEAEAEAEVEADGQGEGEEAQPGTGIPEQEQRFRKWKHAIVEFARPFVHRAYEAQLISRDEHKAILRKVAEKVVASYRQQHSRPPAKCAISDTQAASIKKLVDEYIDFTRKQWA